MYVNFPSVDILPSKFPMPFPSKHISIVLLIATCLQAQAVETKKMQLISGSVPAPDVQFSDGKRPMSLSAYKGKYVLVNFWATWCAPCINEMPALDRLAGRLEKQGVVVVAVSQDVGGAVQVRPFVEKLKLAKMRLLYDTDKRAFRDYALRGLPTTVLISPDGMLLARLEGGAAWDEGVLAEQVFKLTNSIK